MRKPITYATAESLVRIEFHLTESPSATIDEQVQVIIQAACRGNLISWPGFTRDEFLARLASVKALFAHVMGIEQ